MLVKERGEKRGHSQNQPDFRPDYAKVGDWISLQVNPSLSKSKRWGEPDPTIVVPSHPRIVFKVRFEYDDYVTIPSLIPSSIRDGFNSTMVKDLQYLYQVKEIECWDQTASMSSATRLGCRISKRHGSITVRGKEKRRGVSVCTGLVLANVEGYFNFDFRRWEPAVPDHEIDDGGSGDEFGRDLSESAPLQWALVHSDDWNEGFTTQEGEGETEDESAGDGDGGDDDEGDDDDENDGVDEDYNQDESDEDDSSGNHDHNARSSTITSEPDAESSSTEKGSNRSSRSSSTLESGSVGMDTNSRTIKRDDSRAGSTNTVNTFTLALREAASFKKRKSADDHHGGG
ncbi:hypothetical protein ABEF95_001532 [Exophiala dermatitidis]